MPEISTALAVSAIKSASDPAGRLLSKVGRAKYDEIVAKYTNAFSDHLRWSDERTKSVKNFIYSDTSANINEIYVNINFKSESKKYSDLEILEFLKSGGKYIISGSGGAGKTVAMKWLTQQLITSLINHQIVPIFLELRDVEVLQDTDFSQVLFRHCSSVKNKATYNQFLEGLKAGVFCILLDAVDEVPLEHRLSLVRMIERFSTTFPEIGIILSTRPDQTVSSMASFQVLSAESLTLDQAVEIIRKIRFNEEVKGKLVSELREGLYERQKSFLSNPLLVTIMLVTYEQSLEVPSKLSLFYKQAFESLYLRHDATKVWRRKLYAGLPLDEFERFFSTFCYRSYSLYRHEFSEAELLKYIREALEYCSINANAEDVAKDSIECVCLIQRDGLANVFSHRSFQEYFTAVFVSRFHGPGIYEVIDRVTNRGGTENVARLLFEIDQERLERDYVLPYLENVLSRIDKLDARDPRDFRKIALTFVSQISLSRKFEVRSIMFKRDTLLTFMHSLFDVYPEFLNASRQIFGNNAPIIVGEAEMEIAQANSSPSFRSLAAAALEDLTDGSIEDQYRCDIYFTPAECRWLCHSRLAENFEAVRDFLLGLRNRIQKDIEEKDKRRNFLFTDIK